MKSKVATHNGVILLNLQIGNKKNKTDEMCSIMKSLHKKTYQLTYNLPEDLVLIKIAITEFY